MLGQSAAGLTSRRITSIPISEQWSLELYCILSQPCFKCCIIHSPYIIRNIPEATPYIFSTLSIPFQNIYIIMRWKLIKWGLTRCSRLEGREKIELIIFQNLTRLQKARAEQSRRTLRDEYARSSRSLFSSWGLEAFFSG